MDSSFKLGRLAGIEIGINFSIIFVVALLSFGLADSHFPQQLPKYSNFTHFALGATAAILFFVSILWHEMAHALTARYFGLPVRRIVLFIFGGVAEIEKEPRSASQEFWIVAAGPSSSVLLGVGLWSVGMLGAKGTPLREVMFWLGEMNIILAGFNMLPSFPLDGGRIFRAAIWFFSGSYLKATRIAVRTGQLFAILFMIGGTVGFVFPMARLSALLMIFTGWFLWSIGRNTLEVASLQAANWDIPIRQAINHRLMLKPEWSVHYALDMMSLYGARHSAPVVNNDEIVGMFNLEAVARLPRLSWGTAHVGQLMRSLAGLPRVAGDADLLDTLRQMEMDHLDYVVVTHDARPIAILGRHELMLFAQHQRRAKMA